VGGSRTPLKNFLITFLFKNAFLIHKAEMKESFSLQLFCNFFSFFLYNKEKVGERQLLKQRILEVKWNPFNVITDNVIFRLI
jgi:hypothetical protein